EDAAGNEEWTAEGVGRLAQRYSILFAALGGDALQVARWDELRMDSERLGNGETQLVDLASKVAGDEIDGLPHLRQHPLRFVAPRHRMLGEAFSHRDGSDGVDASLELLGHDAAIGADAGRWIGKVVVGADALDVLPHAVADS